MTSRIDPALVQAYRETEYRVLGAHAMVLRLDVHSDRLVSLHQAFLVECSVFITAYNPYSQRADLEVNIRRQSELAELLESRGLVVFQGIGRHPGGRWAGEPGFLVPGMPLDEACDIGRQFRQNAIICCGVDATPRLILLR